jgi:hypothetical protein
MQVDASVRSQIKLRRKVPLPMESRCKIVVHGAEEATLVAICCDRYVSYITIP